MATDVILHRVLTVHHGDQAAAFSEHPTERVRRALRAAARVETEEWSALLLRMASALPDRGPIRVREEV
jgi:hypothetical protein